MRSPACLHGRDLLPHFFEEREDLLDRRAVLALQPVDGRQPVSISSSRAGIGFQPDK